MKRSELEIGKSYYYDTGREFPIRTGYDSGECIPVDLGNWKKDEHGWRSWRREDSERPIDVKINGKDESVVYHANSVRRGADARSAPGILCVKRVYDYMTKSFTGEYSEAFVVFPRYIRGDYDSCVTLIKEAAEQRKRAGEKKQIEDARRSSMRKKIVEQFAEYGILVRELYSAWGGDMVALDEANATALLSLLHQLGECSDLFDMLNGE